METRSPDDLQARLDALAELSLDALPRMFDDRTGLSCHKAVQSAGACSNHGSNGLYTAMSVVGLLRQTLVSPDKVFALGRALDALHRTASGGPPELLANIVWASVLAGDRRGERVAVELAEHGDPRRCNSSALGHAVHALAVAADAYPQRSRRTLMACRRWIGELLSRFSPAADLFGPITRPTGARSALTRRVTSFAAQVYPLHGLGTYHRITGETPGPALRRVADRIVAAQGPLGQWWWLYSTEGMAILEGYPVYSVHQDAMAFMALLPIEALGEGSYRESLSRGLDWLSGRNELSVDLVHRDPPMIFRNIQRTGSNADAMFGVSRANLARIVIRSLHPMGDHTGADPRELEVLHECRPYHLGWLLYAQALVAE